MEGDRSWGRASPLVSGVGVALFLLAVGHHSSEINLLNGVLGPAAGFVVDSIPALGIAYAGYWLSGTALPERSRWTVLVWSLAGLLLLVGVIGVTMLIRVFEGRLITEPVFVLLVGAEGGMIAGFTAGYFKAQLEVEAERAKRAHRELAEANRRLETSNERLEHFASVLSHDLQEPLRMVSSYLQLLENRYGDELDDDARDYIDYAVGGAARMRSMIDSLHDYSRVTTNANALKPTDLEAVVEDVRRDLQVRIEETDASISVGDLPTARADAEQLGEVFRNLLTNAIRHCGDEPPEISIKAARDGDMWRISVEDEGVGIDPAYHDRIFDVFEQLDRDTGEHGESGLGLALCERIVERHGGDIWVESEPGEGATFSFTVPGVQYG